MIAGYVLISPSLLKMEKKGEQRYLHWEHQPQQEVVQKKFISLKLDLAECKACHQGYQQKRDDHAHNDDDAVFKVREHMALCENSQVISKEEFCRHRKWSQFPEVIFVLEAGSDHIEDGIDLDEKQYDRQYPLDRSKRDIFCTVFSHDQSPFPSVNLLNTRPVPRQIITMMIATALPYPYFMLENACLYM